MFTEHHHGHDCDRQSERERERERRRGATRERERTLLDVTLPEVARILEMQQKHIVAPSPSPAPSPAPAPSTVLGVPVDVFRALEPALLERVLRALGGQRRRERARRGASSVGCEVNAVFHFRSIPPSPSHACKRAFATKLSAEVRSQGVQSLLDRGKA